MGLFDDKPGTQRINTLTKDVEVMGADMKWHSIGMQTGVKQESNRKRVQFNLPTTLVDKLTRFCSCGPDGKQLQSTVVETAIAQYLASKEPK